MNNYELNRIEDACIDSTWKVRRRLFLKQALIRRDPPTYTTLWDHFEPASLRGFLAEMSRLSLADARDLAAQINAPQTGPDVYCPELPDGLGET